MSDKIILGSGEIYIDEFSGTIPQDSALETAAKRLGYIKGGATIYKAIDDLGRVSKVITTDEQATLTCGIMTWNAETLKKLIARGRLTTTAATAQAAGKNTLKIGGGTDDGKKYVIRFVHTDAADGDLRVTIVGKNEAGLELAFAKDAETVVNPEFTALPHDNDGTLIQIDETIPQLSGS